MVCMARLCLAQPILRIRHKYGTYHKQGSVKASVDSFHVLKYKFTSDEGRDDEEKGKDTHEVAQNRLV